MAGDIANLHAELIDIDVPGGALFAQGNAVGIDYAIVPSDLEVYVQIELSKHVLKNPDESVVNMKQISETIQAITRLNWVNL